MHGRIGLGVAHESPEKSSPGLPSSARGGERTDFVAQVRHGGGLRIAYFRRSRILASPARAQLSSSLAPGAPLAPMAPIVSSPSLMTIPPPKNMTWGSLESGAIESSPLARSARAMVSFLNE